MVRRLHGAKGANILRATNYQVLINKVKMPSMQRACKEHAIIKDAQRMQRGCQMVQNVNVQA